jgi:RecA-family ATPase
MATNKVQTLQEIVDTIYPPTPELVKQLLSPKEIVLFIGRQKEGKSTLALQLAIDISRGEPFLNRFDTSLATVLYLDYENRFPRLKERALDLVGSVKVDNLYVKGFDRLHQRDAALFGLPYDRLNDALLTTSADVLLIDPLRYAINKPKSSGTTDEALAVEAIDQIAKLQQQRPLLATILVHHLKKNQNPRHKVKLKDDPHS